MGETDLGIVEVLLIDSFFFKILRYVFSIEGTVFCSLYLILYLLVQHFAISIGVLYVFEVFIPI